MKCSNIAELKNRLSHYLRLVRRGESVLVKDRDRVVARIEPAGRSDESQGDDDQRLKRLESRGLLRRGEGKLDVRQFSTRPQASGDAVRALLQEREEGL